MNDPTPMQIMIGIPAYLVIGFLTMAVCVIFSGMKPKDLEEDIAGLYVMGWIFWPLVWGMGAILGIGWLAVNALKLPAMLNRSRCSQCQAKVRGEYCGRCGWKMSADQMSRTQAHGPM